MLNILRRLFSPSGIKCIACGCELNKPSEGGLCSRCVLPINEPSCAHCGRGFYHLIGAQDKIKLKGRRKRGKYERIDGYNTEVKKSSVLCADCQNHVNYFSKAIAPFSYYSDARRLVARLKFYNNRYLAKYFAFHMADAWLKSGINFDFITYVPMTKRGLRRRGYNQSALIASFVAKRLNKRCVDLLDRVKDVKMSALNRIERAREIKSCFRVIDGIKLNGQSVLLIDDVLTTGATSNECAKCLMHLGASSVYVLTFASAKAFIKQ